MNYVGWYKRIAWEEYVPLADDLYDAYLQEPKVERLI